MSVNRYIESKKKSIKLPVIIIVGIVVLALLILTFVYFNSSNKNINNNDATKQPSTVLTTDSADSTQQTQEETVGQPATQNSRDDHTEAADIEENTKVVVPARDDESMNYFSGEFSPYKAVDTDTNTECSLKEVFGSSYSGGSITFNSDGSFSDTLSISSVNSGGYALSNNTITATYTNDKNVTIAVIDWNGEVPSGLIINYGGYDVYFN